MSVSSQIKALLALTGHKQADLAPILNKSKERNEMPKQSLSNKFAGERWSASDLIKIADFTGSKLAFILPNGERVVLDSAAPTHGVSAEAVGGGVTPTAIREEEKDS